MSPPIYAPSAGRGDMGWHQVCDALDEPVLIVDAKERVINLNRPALRELGCTAESAQSLNLANLYEEPWRGCRALARIVRLRGSERERDLRDTRTGRQWTIRCRFLEAESPTETTHSPSAGNGFEDGFADGGTDDRLLLLVLRETTELRSLRDAMRQFEKSRWLADIVGDLAHHVNNPLFAISMSVELLKGRPVDRREQTEMLTAVQEEVDRLTDLMRSFVEFSRASCRERGRHELGPLVSEACAGSGLGGEGDSRRVELQIESGVEALVDRQALRLALIKILENSRDLSSEGATIRITGRRASREGPRDEGASPDFELRIRDQGPGIPPAYRRQIFEPFFSRRSGHHGLGLALANRILVAHGGSMACEECHDGASLVLRLPVAVQRSDQEESP